MKKNFLLLMTGTILYSQLLYFQACNPTTRYKEREAINAEKAKIEIIRNPIIREEEIKRITSHADSILESYNSDLQIIREDTLTQPPYARTPESWAAITKLRQENITKQTIIAYIQAPKKELITKKLKNKKKTYLIVRKGSALTGINALATTTGGREEIKFTHELFHILYGTKDYSFRNPLSRIPGIYSYNNLENRLDLANKLIVEANLTRKARINYDVMEYLRKEQKLLKKTKLDKKTAALVIWYSVGKNEIKPDFLRERKEYLQEFIEKNPNDPLEKRIKKLLIENERKRTIKEERMKEEPAIIDKIMKRIIMAEKYFDENKIKESRKEMEEAMSESKKIPDDYEFKNKILGYEELAYMLIRARQDGIRGAEMIQWIRENGLIKRYKKGYELLSK